MLNQNTGIFCDSKTEVKQTNRPWPRQPRPAALRDLEPEVHAAMGALFDFRYLPRGRRRGHA